MDAPEIVDAPKKKGILTPWKPGQSGNPSGKPKDTIGPLARKHGPEAIRLLLDIMRNARDQGHRIKAAQIILERGFGKPREALEITGTVGLAPAIDGPPSETREAWIERKRAELAAANAVIANMTQVVENTEEHSTDKIFLSVNSPTSLTDDMSQPIEIIEENENETKNE